MTGYRHTQRAPLCWLLYAMAGLYLVLGWVIRHEPLMRYLFPPIALLMLVLAASFHYLRVQDQGDRLLISFGPVPLFQRAIRYEDIDSVDRGRTTLLDGWGIHLSLRGGWVWNLWGRDCVIIRFRRGVLRVGTDDVQQLCQFLEDRLGQHRKGTT